jgi:hypothetical protein
MIDQRFLDDLAQDLKLPDEPQQDMQLASANTGVTTDGGAFVGYRMNMPKGLNTPENMAKQSVLIADTMAGAGKGMMQAFPGLPGDLESIGRMALNYLGYNVDENTALPTSEEIGKRLESVLGPVIPPNQTTGVPTEERVRAAEGGELGGELVAPGGQLKLASKVVKPVIKATGEIIEMGKNKPLTAYRGSVKANAEESTMAPGLTFLSTDKKAASQYGDVAKWKLRNDIKLLDYQVENPEARRLAFVTGDIDELKSMGINSPDDFIKNPDAFEESVANSYSDNAIGLFPGKNAELFVKSFGYDGVKVGKDDFWIIGKPSDYQAKAKTKESK